MELRSDKENNSQGSASLRSEEPELRFLLTRDTSDDWPRWKRDIIGSAAFHVVAITALFLIKGSPSDTPPPERSFVPYVTHLVVPKELTQKAPNKGPVAKQLTAPAVAPSPKLTEPPPKAAQKAPPAPQPAPRQQPPPPQPAPAVEVARNQPAATPPPPSVPKPEPPKMIVAESLQAQPVTPKPTGPVAPGNPVQDALRSLTTGGSASSSTRVGDSDDLGIGSGVRLPASQPRPQSSLQLKSDPMGVDFKSYLLQVLQAVRTNWFAVYPEAARLGSRGRVVIEFAVAKDGDVTKIVFGGQSGSRALDQAAVAAISASRPLPQLPKEFKGDSIVLEMSFMYNMPR